MKTTKHHRICNMLKREDGKAFFLHFWRTASEEKFALFLSFFLPPPPIPKIFRAITPPPSPGLWVKNVAKHPAELYLGGLPHSHNLLPHSSSGYGVAANSHTTFQTTAPDRIPCSFFLNHFIVIFIIVLNNYNNNANKCQFVIFHFLFHMSCVLFNLEIFVFSFFRSCSCTISEGPMFRHPRSPSPPQ